MREADDSYGGIDGRSEPAADARVRLAELEAEVARLRALTAEQETTIARLKALSREDELTRILNRRGLFDEIERAIGFSARYSVPVSLAYLDLDGFKAINDRYGHAVGDRILVELVERLQAILRDSDAFGRIGGDEFVVLLWQTTPDLARAKALVIAEAIAGRTFCADLAIPVTAAVGVAALTRGDDAAALIVKADDDMYRVKLAGRDAIAAAPP